MNIPILHELEVFLTGLVTSLANGLSFLGTHRWAAAIVLLTLIVRTALLPLAIKQVRSMQAVQRLQPEMKRLQQKYKKDRQKLNQEMMELYKREGVNPLGGCLPIIAQMPVLFAMYYAIRRITAPATATLIGAGVAAAAAREAAGLGVMNMPFLGLANACVNESLKMTAATGRAVTIPIVHCGLAAPTRHTIAGILLLVIMTATSWLSAKQMSANQDPQQARIAQLMPLVFVFVMINFPAALVLYWTTQNVYQLVQQTVMLRTKQIQPPPATKPRKR